MPTYDYECAKHGYFEKAQSMSLHASADCPECGDTSPQVMLSAPCLDVEAMADIGMPGAMETSGNRLTRRHVQAGQSYVHPEKGRKYGK